MIEVIGELFEGVLQLLLEGYAELVQEWAPRTLWRLFWTLAAVTAVGVWVLWGQVAAGLVGIVGGVLTAVTAVAWMGSREPGR